MIPEYHFIADQVTLDLCWEHSLQLWYFVTCGYDSEWTKYEGDVSPLYQADRLRWAYTT